MVFDDKLCANESRRDELQLPRLVHLADTPDLRVAHGDRDIRGWEVRTADGEKVGTVSDLIVDTQHMKVRCVEVRIDREVLNSSSDRYVLIALNAARLDDGHDRVFLDASIVDPRSLPPYDRESLSWQHPAIASDPHASAAADEPRFFGQRRGGRDGASHRFPLDDAQRPPNQLP